VSTGRMEKTAWMVKMEKMDNKDWLVPEVRHQLSPRSIINKILLNTIFFIVIHSGTPGQDGKDGSSGTFGQPGQYGTDGKDGQAGTPGPVGPAGTPGTDGTGGQAGTGAI